MENNNEESDLRFYVIFGKAIKKVPILKILSKIPLLNKIRKNKKFQIEFMVVSPGFFPRTYLNEVTQEIGYHSFIMTNIIEIEEEDYLIYSIEEDEQNDNTKDGFQAI